MILAIARFFIKLDRLGSGFFEILDDPDVMMLLAYGPWFIFAIWAVVDSWGSMPFIVLIILSLLLVSACGAITTFLLSILKIALMGIFIPIQLLAAWSKRYEERKTGIGKYIEADRKANGDILWHAAYLHD